MSLIGEDKFVYNQNENYIEFPLSQHAYVGRAVMILFGIIPFYVPYELLYKPNWNWRNWDWSAWREVTASSFIVFFVIFAVALGAAVVGLMFIFFGLSVFNKYAKFDGKSKTFIFGKETGITRYQEERFTFAQIESVNTVTAVSSDGPDNYHIVIKLTEGKEFVLYGAATEEETKRRVELINQLLKIA